MKSVHSRGFSLIELLLVIAVIGVLVAMAAVASRSTRDKAQDSRVEAGMAQLRRLGEDYYNSKNLTYLGWETCVTTPSTATCATQQLTDSVTTLTSDIATANGLPDSITVLASAKSFCMTAPLKANASSVLCSDSSGRTAVMAATASCTITGSGASTFYSCP